MIAHRLRPVVPQLVLYIGVLLACVGLVTVPGCGADQRQKTLRAAFIGTNAARDGFATWDASHQKAIVDKAATREDGERELAAYRASRVPIVETFEAVYRALALAATQTDDPSLRAALAASAELLEAIKKLTTGGS